MQSVVTGFFHFTFSRFTQVVAWISVLHFFSCLNSISWHGYITLYFLHQFMDSCVVLSLTFPIIRNTMNKFLCGRVFVALGHMPGNVTAGHVVTVPRVLRNCQAVCWGHCTSSHSHLQRGRAPISPHPPQHLLLPAFVYSCHPSEGAWSGTSFTLVYFYLFSL